LPSERDQNFLLETRAGQRFVLKIANATESPALLEAQNAALERMASHGDFCPRLVRARNGDAMVSAGNHLVRLVAWLPGQALAETRRHSPALLEDLGATMGRLDRALETFDHPAVHRHFYWDLAVAAETMRERLRLIGDPVMRRLVEEVLQRVEGDAPILARLPRSVIHNDANDYNVLVSDQRVTGLIDFGDMVHTFTVADPAVAMAYVALDKPDPLGAIARTARGYHTERPFSDDELAVLFDLVCLRLALSVCVAADQQPTSRSARSRSAARCRGSPASRRGLPRGSCVKRAASTRRRAPRGS
jgi:Ser/Thr protein kinase RdoA (MazF antagonist)